jgi:hypothetical protein
MANKSKNPCNMCFGSAEIDVGKLFVAYYCRSRVQAARPIIPEPQSSLAAKLVVQQFVHEELVYTYHFNLFSNCEIPNRIRIMTLDDGAIGFSGVGNLLPNTPMEDQKSQRDETFTIIKLIRFDIHAKTFEMQYYRVPGCYRPQNSKSLVEQVHFWRHQVLTPIYHDIIGVRKMLLMGVNQRHTDRNRLVAVYGERGPDDREIQFYERNDQYKKYATSYCWAGGPKFTEKAVQSLEPGSGITDTSRVVRGDDEFIVLFGLQGYVVWCFNKQVSLTTADVIEAPEGCPVSHHPLVL